MREIRKLKGFDGALNSFFSQFSSSTCFEELAPGQEAGDHQRSQSSCDGGYVRPGRAPWRKSAPPKMKTNCFRPL